MLGKPKELSHFHQDVLNDERRKVLCRFMLVYLKKACLKCDTKFIIAGAQ
jgi:hypothetical protein